MGASHGWVPAKTHSAPVLPSGRRLWVARRTRTGDGVRYDKPHVEVIATLVPQILTQMVKDSGGAQPQIVERPVPVL